MQNLNLILFLCFALPLSMGVFVCGKKSKRVLLFFLFGTLICLFSGDIANIIIDISGIAVTTYSRFITPVIEELFKALPILIYAIFLRPRKRTLLECSLLLGIGFGMLENAYIIAVYSESIMLSDFIGRAFGSGMMHGVCTFAVGHGMTFLNQKKKAGYLLAVSLMLFAIVYHSLYNNLILSSLKYVGFAMPVLAFIPLVILGRKKQPDSEEADKQQIEG